MVLRKENVFSTLCFLLALMAGLYFISFNVVGHKLEFFPGDLGDGRLNLYFLEHAYKYFSGQLNSFWSAPFMVPEKEVISYSDNHLGSAPFYAVFRILGFNIYTAYQLWYLLLTCLNFVFCYLFLNSIIKNKYANILGAMIFTFSLALHTQIPSAQTFARFGIPLTLWMLVLFQKQLKPIYFFLSLISIVYQMYCGIYLGLLLGVAYAVFLIYIIVYNWKRITYLIKSYKWVIGIISSIIISILILLPLILPYIERSDDVIPPDYDSAVLPTIPVLKSYFFARSGSLIWNFLSYHGHDIPGWWGQQLFTGAIATLSILTFWIIILFKLFRNKTNKPINKAVLGMFLTSIVVIFIYLRFNEITAYYLVYSLPCFDAMRSINRIINIDLIFFAFATAYIFSFVLSGKKLYTIALFIILVFAIVFDNYIESERTSHSSIESAQQRIRPLENNYKEIPAGSLTSYEPDTLIDRFFLYHIDAMLLAQKYNLQCINAYTATSPVAYHNYFRTMDSISRIEWLTNMNYKPKKLYVIKSNNEMEIIE